MSKDQCQSDPNYSFGVFIRDYKRTVIAENGETDFFQYQGQVLISNGSYCFVLSDYELERLREDALIKYFNASLGIFEESCAKGMRKKDGMILFECSDHYPIDWYPSLADVMLHYRKAPAKHTLAKNRNYNSDQVTH